MPAERQPDSWERAAYVRSHETVPPQWDSVELPPHLRDRLAAPAAVQYAAAVLREHAKWLDAWFPMQHVAAEATRARADEIDPPKDAR